MDDAGTSEKGVYPVDACLLVQNAKSTPGRAYGQSSGV